MTIVFLSDLKVAYKDSENMNTLFNKIGIQTAVISMFQTEKWKWVANAHS